MLTFGYAWRNHEVCGEYPRRVGEPFSAEQDEKQEQLQL